MTPGLGSMLCFKLTWLLKENWKNVTLQTNQFSFYHFVVSLSVELLLSSPCKPNLTAVACSWYSSGFSSFLASSPFSHITEVGYVEHHSYTHTRIYFCRYKGRSINAIKHCVHSTCSSLHCILPEYFMNLGKLPLQL